MIYGNFTDIESYKGLSPRLDRALALLTPDFLAGVGTEKRELDGEALFVSRCDVTTSPDESRLFEYHRRYADIFTLTKGRERVDIASPEALTVTEQRGDYWGCRGEAEQRVFLEPGRFLVLFPGDAHRPGMAAERPEDISRVVFKVLL